MMWCAFICGRPNEEDECRKDIDVPDEGDDLQMVKMLGRF